MAVTVIVNGVSVHRARALAFNSKAKVTTKHGHQMFGWLLHASVEEKNLLLKYIGLPIPFFSKSKFNFSQTVGEMVFVSF